jgi:hypothetical protein
MSGLFLVMVVGVVPSDANGTDAKSQNEPRPFHIISREMHVTMKSEAIADRKRDKTKRAQKIRDLCTIYVELKRDPRLSTAPTLQRYKAMLWKRLTLVRTDLERDIARQDKSRRKMTKEEMEAERQRRLALSMATESLANQITLVSHSMGGPANLFAESGGGFGGGMIADNGQDLVDLIQRIIQPDFWDVNGGPGAIFYYAPLHALVVSATGEVHRKIGGNLKGLRRAGGF